MVPCPPMQFQPILPVCPKPIPEPCPVSSDNKTVIVEGAGDVKVTREDGVYYTVYTVSFDGFEKLRPFTREELTELFDSVDIGGI